MKKILSVASIAAIAISLFGCSGEENESSSSETVLTVWGWRAESPWQELMESFTADGIRVDYKPFKAEEYDQILQTGLSSSSGPDIVMLRSYGGLQTVVAGGEIATLSDNFPGIAKIPALLVDGARSQEDGKVYGVPFQSVTANVIYNKTLLDSLGLSEPATWDEFIDLNEALLREGVTPMAAGALDAWMLPVYRDMFGAAQYGGPEFLADLTNGTKTFEDDGYTAANKTLMDLTRFFPRGFEGLSYGDAHALFMSGEAAMYPGGIWELPAFETGMADIELGLFPVPAVTGGEPYTMGYLDGAIGMSSKLTGKKRDAAEEFLTWVGSAEFGQAIAEKLLSIPAVEGVIPKNPLVAKSAEAFATNPTPLLTYVGFDFGTPSGSSLEFAGLQKMVIGDLQPEQVGVEVQKGIAQWFEPVP